MTSKRKSFVLHKDSLEILTDLTDEQAGKLIKAIYAYQANQETELDQITKMVFLPFKNQFVRDNEKYLETCEKRAEAGSKGGSVYAKDPGIDNHGELQLYVIRLYNNDEDFIKIGTTSSKINRRFSGPKNMPYNYEVLYQIINQDTSLALESYFHNLLDEFSYSPIIKFPGHLECFTKEAIKELLLNESFAQAKVSKPKQSKAKLAESKSVSDSDNKSNKELTNDRFSEFWDMYDKKKDSVKCKSKFAKLTKQEIELLFEKLPAYINSTPDKQFRKNPYSWLNGKCWNDEIIQSSLEDHINYKSGFQDRDYGKTGDSI